MPLYPDAAMVQIKTRMEPTIKARRLRLFGSICVLVAAAGLLFYGLGRYALWDDEASQALLAEQVWRTGDTSAVIGLNIIAYDHGAELENLHDRANPPLLSYLMAPFVGADTASSLRPRLPMAICGLIFFALMLRWLWRARLDGPTWILFCIALLCNVSLFLFFRQARYYGISLVCSLAVAYLYFNWRGSRGTLLGMSLLMTCLLASHYMTYAAVCIVLTVDYSFWKRKERPLTMPDWSILLAPQIAIGCFVVAIWNPFATGVGRDLFSDSVRQRLALFWWNLRDMNRCEFGVGLLLLAAPLLWRRIKNPFLLRGPVAILVYCATMTLVSPKVIGISLHVADVRYLVPLIPLCIAVSVLTLRTLIGGRTWLAVPLGLIAFGTNLLNFGPALPEGFRSTILSYLGELRTPVPGPYLITARWINQNVQPGASIWVNPQYAAYPLIYYAPKAIYAWQLEFPPKPQFRGLENIHFFGIEPPDYLIAFGPDIAGTLNVIRSGRKLGFLYQPEATLDRYWNTMHRPELMSHNFTPVEHFDHSTEAIYIFKRVQPKVE